MKGKHQKQITRAVIKKKKEKNREKGALWTKAFADDEIKCIQASVESGTGRPLLPPLDAAPDPRPKYVLDFLASPKRPWTQQRYRRALSLQDRSTLPTTANVPASFHMDEDVAAFSTWTMLQITSKEELASLPENLWFIIFTHAYSESTNRLDISRGGQTIKVPCDKYRWQAWIQREQDRKLALEPRSLRLLSKPTPHPTTTMKAPVKHRNAPWYTRMARLLHLSEIQLQLLSSRHAVAIEAATTAERRHVHERKESRERIQEQHDTIKFLESCRAKEKRTQNAVVARFTAAKKALKKKEGKVKEGAKILERRKDALTHQLKKAARTAKIVDESQAARKQREDALEKESILLHQQLSDEREKTTHLKQKVRALTRNKGRGERQLQSQQQKTVAEAAKAKAAAARELDARNAAAAAATTHERASATHRKRLSREKAKLQLMAAALEEEKRLRLEANATNKRLSEELQCCENELCVALEKCEALVGKDLTLLNDGGKREFNALFASAARRFLRLGLSPGKIPDVIEAAAKMFGKKLDAKPSRRTVEKGGGRMNVLMLDQIATTLNTRAADPEAKQATSLHTDATSKKGRQLLGCVVGEVRKKLKLYPARVFASASPRMLTRIFLSALMMAGFHHSGWKACETDVDDWCGRAKRWKGGVRSRMHFRSWTNINANDDTFRGTVRIPR